MRVEKASTIFSEWIARSRAEIKSLRRSIAFAVTSVADRIAEVLDSCGCEAHLYSALDDIQRQSG